MRRIGVLVAVEPFAVATAGCTRPVEMASDRFRQCLVGSGAEVEGWGAGFHGDRIAVTADIVAVADERARAFADVCATAVSNQLERALFVWDVEVAP